MPSKLQPDRKSKVRWWHRAEHGIIWARTRLLKSQNSALKVDFRMRVETFWQTLTALSITLNSKKIWLLLECRRISNMTKNHHSLLTHVLSGKHYKKLEIWLVRAHQNLILVTIKLLLHLNVRSRLIEGVRDPQCKWENFLKWPWIINQNWAIKAKKRVRLQDHLNVLEFSPRWQ